VKLQIPSDQAARLKEALSDAGRREIGGQMYGEQLAPSSFLVTDLTIQKRCGGYASFFVDIFQATRDAFGFYRRTHHRYERYNYIGEWHSHPSFAVTPSHTDMATMRELVRDPDFVGTFAALIIARLDASGLSAGAWYFDVAGHEASADLEICA
jgi:[CysO sulfur-carrier protein]-S-L-cysteine hydrolase